METSENCSMVRDTQGLALCSIHGVPLMQASVSEVGLVPESRLAPRSGFAP